MRFFKVLFKYYLPVIFLSSQLCIAAPQKSLQELKNKIVDNTFPQEIFDNYEFYLLNNRLEHYEELNFLKSLKSSFETEYLQSLILFRKNDFNESFNVLISLFNKTPEYYPYYDLLVKAANITDNEINIKNKLVEMDSSKYKIYLRAELAYQKAEYQEAKKLFEEVLKLDSKSFETIYMLAYTYRNLGDYDSALKYFNKAEKTLEKGDPLLAKVRIAMGSLFYLSGNYDKAKQLYKSGLKIAADSGYYTEKIKALLNLGMILDEEGATGKARTNFDKASKLAAQISDNELEAICLSEYAVSYTYTGEAIKARKNYKKSFLLFKKLKNKNRLAFTAVNIGNSYLNVANYKSSIKYYRIGLNEAGENVRTKMIALRGLGDVYTNLSDYSKALEYYSRAKKIAGQIKDVPSDAEINIGLGVLYYNLDMPKKALGILKEIESNLNESENPYLKLEIDQKIGIIYTSLDSLSSAYSYLKKAANLANQYGDIYSELLSNTFLADITIKRGDVSSAYSLLKETITTTKAIGYNQLLGIQNLLLSDISKLKLDTEKEISYIKKAKVYAEETNDFDTQIRADQKLGWIYEQQKMLIKAEEYYLAAINLIDMNFNRLFQKADIQIKFFSNYYSVYNSLINIYLSENKISKAFEILERSRARNTMQNLVNLKLENSIKNEELLNRYYDFAWKLDSGFYNESELSSLEKQFEIVKDSITQLNPSLAKYINNKEYFSLENIQHNLNNDQYIISYFVAKDYIYVFLISADNFKTKKLTISENKLREMISSISPYYNKENDNKEIAFNKDLFAFNAEGGNIFYKEIVKSIISDIPANSKLIFSLPSEMLTIPFEMLVTEYNDDSSPYLLDDKRFLINDFAISYTPSATIWNELKVEKRSNVRIALLFGDPVFDNKNQSVSNMRGLNIEGELVSRNMNYLRLEYSKDEIQSISSLLSDDQVYLSQDATETVFKKNVEDASIIHLSTHSFLYKNNPLILFSNTDTENDGFLEVGEILQLNLKSDMVVLSSCKSGLGKVDKAEGIIGMQKAFFDAGAKSVIVSLWDVNDKYTSIFMEYFYSFLSSGVNKSEALRLAKLKFINENNSNPYYWAAFTLAGNNAPIDIKIKSDLLFIILSGLVLGLILIMYVVYLQKSRNKINVRTTVI